MTYRGYSKEQFKTEVTNIHYYGDIKSNIFYDLGHDV